MRSILQQKVSPTEWFPCGKIISSKFNSKPPASCLSLFDKLIFPTFIFSVGFVDCVFISKTL